MYFIENDTPGNNNAWKLTYFLVNVYLIDVATILQENQVCLANQNAKTWSHVIIMILHISELTIPLKHDLAILDKT